MIASFSKQYRCLGYTVHGPRPADKTIDIPRKVYDLGIRNALSLKFKQDELMIVDSLLLKEFQNLHLQDQVESISKKELLRAYLAALNLDGKKVRMPLLDSESNILYLDVFYVWC